MADDNKLYEKFAQKQLAQQAFNQGEGGVDTQVVQGPIDDWKNPNAYEDTWMAKFGDPIYNALTETRPGAAFLGYGKGFGQAVASIPNTFLPEENKIKVAPNLDEYVNPEMGGWTQAGEVGGNIAAGLYGAGKLGSALGGLTGAGGTAARVGGTAGLEYLMGEQFPEALGGRMGAATLGALFPVSPIAGGATRGQIGKNVIKGAEQAEAKYGGKITEILSKADPIDRVKRTHALDKIVGAKTHIPAEKDVKGLVNTFLSKPSAQAAQDAISGMKGALREIKPHHIPESMLPKESAKQYRLVKEGIQDLEKVIEKSLSPSQFKQYKEALEDYVSHAVPYKQTAIDLARKGRGPASNIPRGIFNIEKNSATLPGEFGEEAINQFKYLMQKHPELYVQKYAPILAGASGIGTLGKGILDYFKSAVGGENESRGEY
jgi:hypothetical protein